jgi:hypothetical protein
VPVLPLLLLVLLPLQLLLLLLLPLVWMWTQPLMLPSRCIIGCHCCCLEHAHSGAALPLAL